jgi:hypothetical protein
LVVGLLEPGALDSRLGRRTFSQPSRSEQNRRPQGAESGKPNRKNQQPEEDASK